jgi:NADH-quinone oxidoreductase subunit J
MLHASTVVLLGGLGTWLLLPHRRGQAKPELIHLLGAILTLFALVAMAALWTPPGTFLSRVFFYVFGIVAVGGGIMTVTSRSPVHSALWFASVVLSTAGLFLLSGAAFLAAGTVIVYAGAIIVTFLFVIMLAQSEGLATYDRAARSPRIATLTAFLLMWAVLYCVATLRPAASRGIVSAAALPSASAVRAALPSGEPLAQFLDRAVSTQSRQLMSQVAALGGSLYTDHLLTAELVGVLLFVALVGAATIATPKAPVRPGRAVLQRGGDPAQARAIAPQGLSTAEPAALHSTPS